ncbi:MAG TPA: hypothetical protein VN018_02145 [Brevundimonas sp.]|nr:hypothetical protein [Brevundimonas sp.]
MSLTLAHDRKQSSAAVALFADAARLELRWIKVRLAVIETAVAALPTASRLRGAN